MRLGRLTTYTGWHAGLNAQVRAAFHPFKPLVITSARSFQTVHVWNWWTGEKLMTISDPAGRQIEHAAFSPDGTLIVTLNGGGSGGGLQVWDAVTGAPGTSVFGETPYSITQFDFSPDRRLLISGGASLYSLDYFSGETAAVRLWELQHIVNDQPLERPRIQFDTPVGFDLSPDGSLLITYTAHEVQIWDMAVSLPLTPVLKSPHLILEATIAPDNRTIAVASEDGTTHLWRFIPSELPLEHLKRMAQLQAGNKLLEGTGLVPLSGDEQRQMYVELNGISLDLPKSAPTPDRYPPPV